MIDTHTHCLHSHDSQQSPRDMIEKAISLNMEYLAITDHFDGELTLLPEFSYIRQIDLENHFSELIALKNEYADRIQVGVGIECGYMKEADCIYLDKLSKYDFDMTINSVHMVEYEDCYFKSYFDKRTKFQAYEAYLKAVRESLDCPYHYDSVAHIGYVARKATYPDTKLRIEEHQDLIDDILKTIIAKGKSLEVNTNSKGTGEDFLPSKEILQRYRQLGGSLLTFGSDAHTVDRIGDKYSIATEFLKSIGFQYIFKYISHQPIAVKL